MVEAGLVISVTAEVRLRRYSSGLAKPCGRPAAWSASAMMPAITGEDRLVPPIRYSSYSTSPLGNVCVSPTRYPVLGSPSAAMSGTARPVRPCAANTDGGTTHICYSDSANTRLTPPPPPYSQDPGGVGDHADPVQLLV